MIQSFADRETERFFHTEKSRRHQSVDRVAMRKLIQLNHAMRLGDLSVPPGNRLEPLKGKLDGYHSIRINRQWRITFRWTPQGPSEVEICDYH